jgi:hypothetical protein
MNFKNLFSNDRAATQIYKGVYHLSNHGKCQENNTVFLLSWVTMLLTPDIDFKLDIEVIATIKICQGVWIRDPALSSRPRL